MADHTEPWLASEPKRHRSNAAQPQPGAYKTAARKDPWMASEPKRYRSDAAQPGAYVSPDRPPFFLPNEMLDMVSSHIPQSQRKFVKGSVFDKVAQHRNARYREEELYEAALGALATRVPAPTTQRDVLQETPNRGTVSAIAKHSGGMIMRAFDGSLDPRRATIRARFNRDFSLYNGEYKMTEERLELQFRAGYRYDVISVQAHGMYASGVVKGRVMLKISRDFQGYVTQPEALQHICAMIEDYIPNSEERVIDLDVARQARTVNEFFVTAVVPVMARLLAYQSASHVVHPEPGMGVLQQYGELILSNRNKP